MEDQILACYEALCEASSRMLLAARADNLDALVAAEAECGATIARLRCLGDGVPLSPAGGRRKMAMIQKVLAEDAQIRELTQPWLRRLEVLIGGTMAQKKLQGAYG